MPRPSRETIMTALFNTLTDAVQTDFVADTTANNVELTNVGATSGLYLGLPVFGASIPRGSVITALSPLTLSIPPLQSAAAVAMTTGFLTTGRRLKRPRDVSQQPALFLTEGDEDSDFPATTLQIMTLNAEVWIYANAGENPDAVPVTLLNNLLDAIDAALVPDNRMTNQFTLGGLVAWCRRQGRVIKDPGDTSDQAAAMAEIIITVP